HEEIITCGLGVLGFFTLTDRPDTARSVKELAIQRLEIFSPYIIGTFFTMLIPYMSWKFDRGLGFFSMVSAPFVMDRVHHFSRF
ncbi:hypothetical protein L218DRAFT_1027321, partial [Marasmius fiardii PR-910]